jgi:hypothetical protein
MSRTTVERSFALAHAFASPRPRDLKGLPAKQRSFETLQSPFHPDVEPHLTHSPQTTKEGPSLESRHTADNAENKRCPGF